MIFEDDEIIKNANRCVIDKWCTDHIVNYASLSIINEFLESGLVSCLPYPITIFGYEENIYNIKFVKTYPTSFLDKDNNLIMCGDKFHNLLIKDTIYLPDFIKLEKIYRLTIDFKEKLKQQYLLKMNYESEYWTKYAPKLTKLISKEYEHI